MTGRRLTEEVVKVLHSALAAQSGQLVHVESCPEGPDESTLLDGQFNLHAVASALIAAFPDKLR